MSRKLNYFQTGSKVQPININAYLDRIGLAKNEPDLKFLQQVHKGHLLHIPFENLDIHYQTKIVLDIEKIFEKIVVNNRGGFCYELNALLYHLLSNLGYDCSLLSASVRGSKEWGPEFDHMIILVKLNDENWILDVGFGSLFVAPKKLDINLPQLDYNNYYKFEKDIDGHFFLRRSNDNLHYTTIYKFDLTPHELIEFIPMCNFHQESAKSIFTQNKLITQLFRNGRITLTDRKLKLELNGDLQEFPIMNEDEFLSKLENHFGMDSMAIITNRLNR